MIWERKAKCNRNKRRRKIRIIGRCAMRTKNGKDQNGISENLRIRRKSGSGEEVEINAKDDSV
jgi:hypothetical protein